MLHGSLLCPEKALLVPCRDFRFGRFCSGSSGKGSAAQENS